MREDPYQDKPGQAHPRNPEDEEHEGAKEEFAQHDGASGESLGIDSQPEPAADGGGDDGDCSDKHGGESLCGIADQLREDPIVESGQASDLFEYPVWVEFLVGGRSDAGAVAATATGDSASVIDGECCSPDSRLKVPAGRELVRRVRREPVARWTSANGVGGFSMSNDCCSPKRDGTLRPDAPVPAIWPPVFRASPPTPPYG